jgi:microcystin-dependent protein
VTTIPPGRGRWRLTLHSRQYAPAPITGTLITELVDARARVLTQAWDSPAQLVFTLDGHNPAATYIDELTHDVYAWRWDEAAGRDRLMFRGVIGQVQDTIDEQSHTVVVTCHDYLAMMGRRFLTSPRLTVIQGQDQDDIASALVAFAYQVTSSDGSTSFAPGSYLPLELALVNPDGTPRGKSGVIRDRTYTGGQILGTALDDLAKVIDGFDYDCLPHSDIDGVDQVRIFYPSQGVERDDCPLVYGSTVSTVQRATDSGTYANYWRVLGNANAATTDPQLWADSWSADANDITRIATGLWMGADNAASVTDVTTLQEQAAGDVALYGEVTPSWTVGLRPGAYRYGFPNMGDTVPLIVQSGRLNIDTTIRVLGFTFTIGDDGQEDVGIVVGRPTQTLGGFLTQTNKTVADLVQRESATVVDNPVGCLLLWDGDTPPLTWVWADGSAMSKTTYPELFTVLGYRHGGTGDTFYLPDARSRMIVGVGQGSGLTNRVSAATGGVETVALTSATIGSHAHGVSISAGTQDTDHHHTAGTQDTDHIHAASGQDTDHTHAGSTGSQDTDHHHSGTTGTQDTDHHHTYVASLSTTGGSAYVAGGFADNTSAVSSGVSAGHGHPFTSTGVSAGHGHGVTTGGVSSGHSHALGGVSAGHSHALGGVSAGHGHPVNGNTAATGSGGAHENMPPWLAIGYIIRILPPWRPNA